MDNFPVTDTNKVKRVPKRGHYDKKTLYKIIDDAFYAHVGFNVNDQPFVIPMVLGRYKNKIYLHGAVTSRLMRQAGSGIPVCIAITHLDGIVVARSAFHSSLNYRSAVIFGSAVIVEKNKKKALKILTDHLIKGRWEECRPVNEKELKATTVLEITIDQASSKIRTGPPNDEPADMDLSVWAGVLPLNQTFEKPVPDPKLKKGLEIPDSVKNITRSDNY